MTDNSAENGDADFERFLKDSADKNADRSLLITTYSLKEKTRFITNFYNATLEAYMKVAPMDPIKDELKKTIIKLSKYSMRVLNQFDFILLDEIDEDEEDKI